MLTRFTGTPQNKAALVDGCSNGRLGLSEELANAILFIASTKPHSSPAISSMSTVVTPPLIAHCIQSEGRIQMANVIKKHSISSELAQKMVDAAVAKAKAIGVSENVAILDDAAISSLWPDGWSADPVHRDCAETRLTPLVCAFSTHDLFKFIQADPSLFSRHAHACARGGVGRRVSHQGGRRNCRRDRVERGAHGCRTTSISQWQLLALVPDAMPAD